jgi:hypothetical protein
MKCQHCNSENANDAKFCVVCGEELKRSTEPLKRFCTECGQPLGADAVFCGNCGNSVEKKENVNRINSSSVHEKPIISFGTPKKDKKKIVIGIVVAVVAVLAYMIFWIVDPFGGSQTTSEISGTDKNYSEETHEVLTTEDSTISEEAGVTEKTEETVQEVTEIPDFSGSWLDSVSQRCNMEIISQNDVYYEITIDWSSSASESTHWSFEGEYDASQGGIVYQNGSCYELDSSGGTVHTSEMYTNGEGLIYIKDGKLYWDDKTQGAGDSCEFERTESSDLSSDDYEDYILPDSDTVLLTEADIADLSLQEINYAKNEIYARHGRKFKSSELQNYFNSKYWYE